MLIATGARQPEVSDERSDRDYAALRDAVTDVSRNLAQAIVRDGEGATKFITITVEGGRDVEECREIALRDRQFAAGEDRVLRVRPQPRAASWRDRQRRRRRPRSGKARSVPRRRAGGRRTAGAARTTGRRTASARMKQGRDHGARHARPRRGARHACGPATCRTTTSASTPTTAVDT